MSREGDKPDGSGSRKRKGGMTRRGFLQAGGGLVVGSLLHAYGCGGGSSGGGSPPIQLLGRVVHIYSPQATNWDFGQDYYGRFVDQAVVDSMIDAGIMELTGTGSVGAAWRRLIQDYAPGRAVAIKVNFNCSPGCIPGCETACADGDNRIDAVAQPVNSVIRGLVGIGVAEQDIWVYDATPGRSIPGRFISRCPYGGVRFFDQFCNEPAEFVSSDPDAPVVFTPPAPIPLPPAQRITDVVVNASYLINMPIVKTHGVGVTLGFKNHFGTITRCSDLHDYVYPGRPYTGPGYNPLVDIHLNPHIANKTVLVIGDALFGNPVNNFTKPVRWTTFGNNAPNSLFFAADPVAADCVMCDLLAAETFVPDTADDYLVLAGNAGLGVFERGDPWPLPYGSGYNVIQYVRLDI